jgi:hypothetical protein
MQYQFRPGFQIFLYVRLIEPNAFEPAGRVFHNSPGNAETTPAERPAAVAYNNTRFDRYTYAFLSLGNRREMCAVIVPAGKIQNEVFNARNTVPGEHFGAFRPDPFYEAYWDIRKPFHSYLPEATRESNFLP